MAAAAVTVVQQAHEQKLDKFAEVAVKVGLGLKPGQELVMTASLDALTLARKITEQAYRAGATLVTTLFTDDEAALMRYRLAPDASFDCAAKWLYEGMAAAFKSGAARLAIAGGNPMLLSNEDPDKVSRANRAVSKAYRLRRWRNSALSIWARGWGGRCCWRPSCLFAKWWEWNSIPRWRA